MTNSNDGGEITVFWFRRDLRLDDNAGLYHALRQGKPVLCIFLFDPVILSALADRDDARVTFIHQRLEKIQEELRHYGSSLCVKFSESEAAWRELTAEFRIAAVYTNSDYEPYARERDGRVATLLREKNIAFYEWKDQVIFEKDELLKEDGTPYTVFTPYKRKWLEKLRPGFHLKSYPTLLYGANFLKEMRFRLPSLTEIGFTQSRLVFPGETYPIDLTKYAALRDFPAIEGTTKIGLHLRFGTLSIRQVAAAAEKISEKTFLSELIWRDFYAMILWHFPHTAKQAFKPSYDQIRWRNDQAEFARWCEGTTGYPLVDAGMRQLNETGWMHNRVRMVTASFLTKHLLIDWRWGEAYFARKLLDYDMASNVGGWQWAAGSGNDAAPYFRVFNPALQTEKFDPKGEYLRRWIPEFDDPFRYPAPIVDHKFARERVLAEFKRALSDG